METLRERFREIICRDINRRGIYDLMFWLDTTDFYTAPASTKFHGCFEGGLVQHHLNVYDQLKKLCELYKDTSGDESVAIVSLFHDVCKAGYYKAEMRWKKDQNNQWQQYKTYTFNEDFAFGGHGAKSVYIVQSFMHLSPDEAAAINCHMGQWDATTYSNPTEVYCRNKLAWLLHVADEAADFIIENEKGDGE